MSQTEEPTPAPAPDHVYRGRVLPGSRWRSRATSGHSPSLVTVLRVGQRSALVVIEGGGQRAGGRNTSHRAGRRYNVPLDSFLITHELVSQPQGYKPGDELRQRPKTDTVQKYFDRSRYVDQVIEQIEQTDVRNMVADSPLLPPNPPMPESLRRTRREPARLTEPTPVPPVPSPPKEEPVPEPEPPTQPVPTLTEEQADTVVELLGDQQPEPEPDLDPVEQFMEAGRVLLDGLVGRIATVQQDIERLLAETKSQQTYLDRLTRQRNRIEAAVLAAIGSTEGPEEAGPDDDEPEDLPTEPTNGNRPPMAHRAAASERARQEHGEAPTTAERRPDGPRFGPAPLTEGTHRAWALNRLRRDGRLVVNEVADEFAAHFGISRERAVQNLSSILGRQIRKPVGKWPVPVKTDKGVYELPVRPTS